MPVEGLEYASLIGVARLLVLAVLSGGACVWDLRMRRIPNALTFPVAAAGLALALAEGGWPEGGWSLAGLLAGGALFLPFVIYGYVGAGDLKLLAAAGTLLGPLGILRGILLGAILGGIWAVGWLAAKKERNIKIPYAPPYAAGIMIAFFL